jgi:ketosteroid isomerase-like protein
VSERLFPTAQDAENAFYEALERADLEAMMAVWAEDEEILCVHPTGARLSGQDQVRESWTQIFAGDARVRVHVTHQVVLSSMMMEVRSVQENFTIAGEPPSPQGRDSRPAPIVATNVYLRTAAGWRMVVHHASPAPGSAEPAPAREARAPKKLLH